MVEAMSELAIQAQALRELHRPGDPLMLPNAWDAATAKTVEAAGFPEKFEKEGTSLINVRSTADWYRERKQKAAKDQAVLHAGRDGCR